MNSMETVVLEIEGEDGTIGIAEAVPRPGIYGETWQSIYYIVKDYIAPLMIGEDSFAIDRIFEKINRMVYWNVGAKSAVDIALYDLNGKILGTPAYNLMGGLYRTEIPLTWNLAGSHYNIEGEAQEAKRRYDMGYRSFKVKAGVSIEKDVAMCKRVREVCGPEIQIHIDPNQVYNREESLRLVRELEGVIDAVEEPMPVTDDIGRVELASKTDIAILSDESTFTVDAIARQMKLGAIKRLGIKVPRTGFTNSKKALALAEVAGVSAQISMQMECDLGSAACAQLAASSKGINLPCEIGGFTSDSAFEPGMRRLVNEDIEIKDGKLIVPSGPGLGVTLNREKIEKYAIKPEA
jgi:L-alanine-DL-glutamate epimerase-like enolase superfamily enzyme